jgi:hypothetical protein
MAKKKEANLAIEIKKMEDAKRKVAPVKQDEKISFDSWYHQRKQSIPKQHLKEILRADFEARGIKEQSTISEFDRALTLYGVKL